MNNIKKNSKEWAYFSLIAAAASVIGAFVSISKVESNILWLSIAAIISAFSTTAYLITLKRKRKLVRTIKSIHDISHEIRHAISASYEIDDRENAINIERETCSNVCFKLKEIFEELYFEKCNVTIKLIANKSEKLYVSTYVSTIRQERREHEKEISENSEYSYFLYNNQDENNNIYYSNDLCKEKMYMNTNPDWKNTYRSVIVSPIRRNIEIKGVTDDIGFLIVDSMDTNSINLDQASEYLSFYSDQLYFLISTIRQGYKPSESLTN